MSQSNRGGESRREFLKNTGRIAVASAAATTVVPHVHAAENNTIKVALIGCGGRGTGAAANATPRCVDEPGLSRFATRRSETAAGSAAWPNAGQSETSPPPMRSP